MKSSAPSLLRLALLVACAVALSAPHASAQSVIYFGLFDADTDQAIRNFEGTDQIDLAELPSRNLAIVAYTASPSSAGAVESVRFSFAGQENYRTENSPPYALGGDTRGDYAPVPELAVPGSYVLIATPYTGNNATGTEGESLTLRLDVIDSSTLTYPPVGQSIWLRALINDRFVRVDTDRGGILIADQPSVGAQEQFEVLDGADNVPETFFLRAANGNLVETNTSGVPLTATDTGASAGPFGRFWWYDQGSNEVCIQSIISGGYVSAERAGGDPLVANREWCRSWERFEWGIATPPAASLAAARAHTTAYPNPSAGRVTFEYALAEAGPATLEVFDVVGRRVAVAASGNHAAGLHRADFDGGGLASGLYHWRLTTAQSVEHGRITVAR